MPFRGSFPNSPNTVACFEETAGGGDPQDINSARNAPAKTPANYLDKITWHSDLFQYEIAYGPTTVTVNHPSVAASTLYYGVTWNGGSFFGSPTPQGVYFVVQGTESVTDHLLVTHGLGYVPKVMVVYDGRILPTGHTVQLSGSNSRRVSVYVTSTGVYLRDLGISSNTALSAISLNYTVLVFRNPTANPLKKLFEYGVAGMSLARGIVDTSKKYLRRTGVGDSPFSLNMGPTLDVQNGGVRSATGGITVSDPNYSGSMAAPSYVSVGVE